jgi:hypothetical protein
MPGDPGVTVVTNSCAIFIAREAAGASGAQHSLRPLISQGQEFKAKLARKARRDREAVSSRHCEERKRRSNPAFFFAAQWIASLRSQ